MDKQLLQEMKAYIEQHLLQKDGYDFSAFRRVKTRLEESIPDFMVQSDRVFEPEYKEATTPKQKTPAPAPQQTSCFSMCAPKGDDLEEYIKRLRSEDTFSTLLLKYIDLTGLADADIYKRAGIDRRHFSKIRCDKDYKPKKATALALCLALRLDEEKTGELLRLAGYSLSNSDTGDLVVKFCIERGIYELMDVNEALVYFGQKAIGVMG